MPPRADVPGKGSREDTRPVNKKATVLRLLRYMMKFRWLLLLALVLTVAANVLALMGPSLAGDAVDVIAEHSKTGLDVDLARVGRLAGQMLAVYLLSSVLNFLLQILMVNISRKVTMRMRSDMFARLSSLPVGYSDTHPAGDLISRVFYDTDTVNTSLSSDIVNVLASTVTLTGSLVMMIRISPLLTLIFAFIVPLSILITTVLTKKTQPLFRLRSRKMGELNDFSEERISGAQTMKAYCRERYVLAQLDKLNEEVCDSYYKSEYWSSVMGPSVNLINNIALTMISVFSTLLYLSGGISLGSIAGFVQYSRKFSGPIREIADIFGELQSAIAAADRVFRLMDEESETADAPDALALPRPEGHVRAEHVSFGYEKDKIILKDLSFEAKQGQMIAVVGPTGAGKTTLINLLMRFYDVSDGRVLMDGHDVRDIRRRDVRAAYAMVLQDTWLFNGTVYDNIAYARPDATREEVEAAAKAAHIHSFIMGLPEGYDTVISDDGTNISKGQKQLLTVARAMLTDAGMLILDEATSNVDTRTEVRIQKAMRALMRDKTCFVVAHRLSTVRHADLILVVRNGNVVERGTHDSLMAGDTFYREMYNAQFS